MKINSHNEWDRLREVIVGSAEGAGAPIVGVRFQEGIDREKRSDILV